MTTTRQESGAYREAPPPTTGPAPQVPPGLPPWYVRWVVPAVGLLLLHFTHPLVWVRGLPGWWFPPAGLGIVLVAWLGRRGALLVAIDALLVAAQGKMIGAPFLWQEGWRSAAGSAWEAFVLAAEVLVVWDCYHNFLRGSRRLGDPRSAMLFLILVCALAGAFSVLYALPPWLLAPEGRPALGPLAGGFWLSHTLGILTITPALLTTLTPWLARRRLIRSESAVNPVDHEPARQLRGVDVVEIAFLAVGVAFLELLQAVIHKHPEVPQWHLWSVPLLVIVWASLRQGLRGGTIVAGAAAGLELVWSGFLGRNLEPDPVWQVNLLAQSSTALLVAAAANSIRLSEARYRRVVTRIPVILYSARVKQPAPDGRTPPLAELTFVSPAARALLDTDPEMLLGEYRRWLGFVHPEDREVLLAAMLQLGRQRQPVTCEYRLALPPVDQFTPLPGKNPGAVAAGLGGLRSALKATYGSRVISFQEPEGRPRWVRDTLAPRFGSAGDLEGWDGVVSDITEQRALADDLRRTTSMFHALVANLPAGVFFVQGAEGLPLLVNARARQLLGQHEDPAAGVDRLASAYRLRRADGSAYPTDELPVVAALRRGTTSMRDDIVVHRPDGRPLPLIAWAAPIDLGGQGQHDAAVWVFEDLTAMQQAQAARRESEARLRTVFEAMAEGVMVLDAGGIISDCNPAACAILGLPPERLRGLALLERDWRARREDGSPLPPDEYPSVVSRLTGRPVRGIIMGVPVADSDEVRWLLVNAMPLPGDAADAAPLARVVITFADITAYRQALDVVRASEEKYRGLVETLPIFLVQFDRSGRATYLNPTAQDVSGYGPDDLGAGGAWESLVHPDDLAAARDASRKALGGETTRLEARYRAKDGRDLVGYVLLEPRVQEGAVVGVTALVVDMTRERQLEQELEHAQRLELIGRVSSGIAHDFNNLLTVVLTLAQLAQESLPEDHPARDDLRRIAYAGEQAANLAQQLLAFSKKQPPNPRRLDLNAVARRTLELLRATLPRFIHIEPELADGELPVHVDEMQVQQVLMNLCVNARDAMPKGGRLVVRTEAVAGEPWVRLSVRDDGEGIPEEVLARIFDPFFSTKERGTGLGLAMVRQIAEASGGRVEVASRLGEGARFDVWLPRPA